MKGGKGLSTVGKATGAFTDVRRAVPNSQREAAMKEIVAPGGKLVGDVNKGAAEKVRTVSRSQFDEIKGRLDNLGAGQIDKNRYGGQWNDLGAGNGAGFGVRNGRNGETIDISHPELRQGTRIHQR